ncbi:hypothetical protein K3728_09345 [Rhodobacteraceae bacterium M385]|nr:hypothetical protein K3728_09345 [Rhodobacteraceae bacterium M385]
MRFRRWKFKTIKGARREVLAEVRRIHGNRISHGPFSGMLLGEGQSWGNLDLTGKILGTYESGIVKWTITALAERSKIINIGAGDGYYGIGCLVADAAEYSICFEASSEGRANLGKIAEINGVANRMELKGTADATSVLDTFTKHASDAVVVCDIEGAEFDLWNGDAIELCRHTPIAIELHDTIMPVDQNSREDLLARFAHTHELTIVHNEPIDAHAFDELAKFDDQMRLLAFAEDRPCRMDWLLAMPRA